MKPDRKKEVRWLTAVIIATIAVAFIVSKEAALFLCIGILLGLVIMLRISNQ